MKFILVTKVAPPEPVKGCYESPEELDLELHLGSLESDIEALTIVSSVTRIGFRFELEVPGGTKQADLKAAMKNCFSGDRFCIIRFVTLELA